MADHEPTSAQSATGNTGEAAMIMSNATSNGMTQNPQDVTPTDTAIDVSKRSLKKIAKLAKWEEKKRIKRAKTKLKKKELKARGKPEISRKVLKRKTMENSKCRINIVVDLSFDEFMIDKDVAKCIKQIHRCYSINRRLVNPVQLHVTSFTGESAKVMQKHDGFGHWDMHFHQESYETLYPKESIVYLTSESENVIEKLEEGESYIIGGLVDHNSQKGLCHRLAVEKGFRHARLPIDKFLEMKTRKILSIDHVFEIMANVCQGVSWQEAFIKVIPPRKQVVPKGLKEDDEHEALEQDCIGPKSEPGAKRECASPSIEPMVKRECLNPTTETASVTQEFLS